MKNVSKVVKTLSLIAFVALLAGCSGDSGDNGATGEIGATGGNGETGEDGTTGTNGSDGFVSLIKMNDEPVGANCQNGGVKVESGVDIDSDGVLDAGEVTATEYICSDVVLAENFDGVVYIADKTVNDVRSIYATVNGVDTLLAAPSQSNQNINAFKISPDRSKVAYITNGNLYTVDLLKRSVPVQMNADLVTNGHVVSYEWSPDGSKLAYRGDVDTNDVFELYVVLADGSLNMKAHSTLVGNQDAEPYYEWSHNSQKLAYVTDELSDGAMDLRIVDIAKGSHTLVKAMAVGREVKEMHWSPNDDSIAYRDDSVTDNEYDLYSYNIASTTVTTIKLTSAGSSIDGFSWKPAVIAQNSVSKIAYRETDTSKTDLYTYSFASVPNPSGTVQNTAVLAGEYVRSFKWSQDGIHLAYMKLVSSRGNLYVVASGAATSDKINPTLGVSCDVATYAWGYVPSGPVPTGGTLPDQRLVFSGDIEVNKIDDIYSANLDGTDFINLTNSSAISSDTDAYDFILAEDAKTVLYRMDKDIDGIFELYTIDLYGNNASATAVSGDMPDYADVYSTAYLILQPQ